MRPLIIVAIVLLAMPLSAHAQDEFNVNTNPGSTNPTSASCTTTYNAAREKLNEQDAQAEGQLRKDNLACQSQSRSESSACTDAASKKFWAVHVEVLKGQIDADANRQICDNHIHLATAAAFNAKNKADPCQAQFDQTMGGLNDQNILAEAQLKKDNLDCQSHPGSTASTACIDAEAKKNWTVHQKIINGETDANTNRTICENRKGLAKSGTEVPAQPAAPRPSGAGGESAAGAKPAAPGASNGGGEVPGRPGSPGNPLKGYASAGGSRATGGGSNSADSAGGGPTGPLGSPDNPLKGYASESGGSAGAGASGINGGIPGRMMALAAKMDAAATQLQNNAMAASNEFLKGMADAMGRTAKVYAQKPGTVLPQMIDGIVKYLNADHNKNDQAYYDAAVKAVDEFEKNPARFLGEHALDAAMMGAGVAGEAATGARSAASAAEMGSAAEAAQTAQTAGKLEQAGGTLQGVVSDADKFSTFSPVGNGPDFTKHLPPMGPGEGPSVNLFNGNQNCFPVSMAAAKRWKTGKPYIALDENPHAPMYEPATNKWVYEDTGTAPRQYASALKKNYGAGKASDPLHGNDGLIAHQEGIPVPSSQQKIETALLKAGEDSQGLVFVDGGKNTVGHVFNVRNVGGKVEFWDFQANPPLQYRMFGNGNLIYSVGGKTFSTPIDWTRTFFYRLE